MMMMRRREFPSLWWSLLKNDILVWVGRKSSLGMLIGTILTVGVTLAWSDGGRAGHPLFISVLGGPPVAVVFGRLGEGYGWPWLLVGVLFAWSVTGMMDTGSEWVGLVLVREVSRIRWATAKLVSLAILALGYVAILLLILGIAVLFGWRSGPLVTSGTAWDVGLWAVGLVSIAWFEMAVSMVASALWLSVSLTTLLLVLAAFGGPLAPYVPFSQWIAELHNLPGTLSVSAGVLYLALWASLSGATVVWVAHLRLAQNEPH